jgi:hypothetical protein
MCYPTIELYSIKTRRVGSRQSLPFKVLWQRKSYKVRTSAVQQTVTLTNTSSFQIICQISMKFPILQLFIAYTSNWNPSNAWTASSLSSQPDLTIPHPKLNTRHSTVYLRLGIGLSLINKLLLHGMLSNFRHCFKTLTK